MSAIFDDEKMFCDTSIFVFRKDFVFWSEKFDFFFLTRLLVKCNGNNLMRQKSPFWQLFGIAVASFLTAKQIILLINMDYSKSNRISHLQTLQWKRGDILFALFNHSYCKYNGSEKCEAVFLEMTLSHFRRYICSGLIN